MNPLKFSSGSDEPTVLCLGAHCDDIEIGCGGTLINIIDSYPAATFHYVVFCANGPRKAEATTAAKSIVASHGNLQLHFFDYRDGFLPYEGEEPKKSLLQLAASIQPDVIFTHYSLDAHQDHRHVSELTRNIFRDHLILEYEIPKFDGDIGNPNLYSVLSDVEMDRKIAVVLDSFESQAGKHWFSDETFKAIARLRGIEAGRSATYAEAFYLTKGVCEF